MFCFYIALLSLSLAMKALYIKPYWKEMLADSFEIFTKLYIKMKTDNSS